jgi:Flp pilus assembly protein TadG
MRPFRLTSTELLGSSLRAWGRARDGGVAVTVAVMITVLVGILALAIDVGRVYNASSDLHHAADAYALAGATQLDGEVDACLRAIRAVNEAALANEEVLGSNSPGLVAYVSSLEDPVNNPNIKFLSALVKDGDGNVTGTYITDPNECDENAGYIEITLDLADDTNDAYRVDLYFAGITGAVAEAFPHGYAIAENVSAFCITVPMFMCALDNHPELPVGMNFYEALTDYQLTGRGLFLKSASQSQQWGSGNFGFLDLDQGPLGPQIGPIRGEEQCLTDGEIFTKTGSTSGARLHYNTRFDMWQGPVTEFMNQENYQPSPNAVKGYNRTGGSCAYGPGGYEDPPIQYTGYGSYGAPPSIATLPADAAMPLPRDKCSYTGTCLGFQGRMGNGVWDRATYVEVNHKPRIANGTLNYDANDMNFSATDNTSWDIPWPGGPHPDGQWSRYEMYLWELDRQHASYDAHGGSGGDFGEVGQENRLVDETGDPPGCDQDPAPHGECAGERDGATGKGNPQCYAGDMGVTGIVEPDHYTRDRRVERVLVVNCDCDDPNGVCIQGKTEIPTSAIYGTMNVFLLEPWQVNGGVHEISTEIIGPGGPFDGFKSTDDFRRDWVQLKEGRNALK